MIYLTAGHVKASGRTRWKGFQMLFRTRGRAAVLVPIALGLAAALAACGSSGSSSPQAASTGGISTLASAAKSEGSVTWYTSIPQAIATGEAQAFQTKYGVTVKSVVLTSGLLTTRFSTEKQAGNSQADVLTVADQVFMNSAVQNKWLATLSTSQLTALSAVPAADIHDSAYVLTGTQPIGISYNTSKLKASQVDSWQDLLSPALKGQLYVVNPTNVPSWLAMMDLLRQKYGPSFLKQLAATDPRFVDSSVPGAQQVAAGSGLAVFPSLLSVSDPLQAQGASIGTVFPSPTTGVEQYTAVSSTAVHPDAARLFTDFLMSQAGQVIFNKGTASSPLGSLPGTLPLPKGYQSFSLATAEADKQTLLSLIGQ
jgi:iron(III) transport system substrate-binding protein